MSNYSNNNTLPAPAFIQMSNVSNLVIPTLSSFTTPENFITKQRRESRKKFLHDRKSKNFSTSEVHTQEIIINVFAGVSKGKIYIFLCTLFWKV